jgi:hypothetical protein
LSGDVDRIVRYYAAQWQKSGALLVGYSQGADVLPFAVNRLPEATRALVRYSVLMGLGQDASFEFHVGNWLGSDDDEALPIRPEAAKLDPRRTLCIYGADEKDSLCPQLAPASVESPADAGRPSLPTAPTISLRRHHPRARGDSLGNFPGAETLHCFQGGSCMWRAAWVIVLALGSAAFGAQTTPTTMRAVAIDGPGGSEVLQLRTLPVPGVDASEVLIAVHAAGVASWDIEIRQSLAYVKTEVPVHARQ